MNHNQGHFLQDGSVHGHVDIGDAVQLHSHLGGEDSGSFLDRLPGSILIHAHHSISALVEASPVSW